MSQFKNKVFDFGTVPFTSSVVDWSYEFKEPCKNFHYVNTGCACTLMTDSDKTTFIKGIFQLGLAGISQEPGVHEVSKTITVYYDKDVEEYIPDNIGRRVMNPNKKFEYLTLRGLVEIS